MAPAGQVVEDTNTPRGDLSLPGLTNSNTSAYADIGSVKGYQVPAIGLRVFQWPQAKAVNGQKRTRLLEWSSIAPTLTTQAVSRAYSRTAATSRPSTAGPRHCPTHTMSSKQLQSRNPSCTTNNSKQITPLLPAPRKAGTEGSTIRSYILPTL